MVPVLLPPRLASAARATFDNDRAVDSVVYDLAFYDPWPDPASRFVGVYRAPAGRPGDFVVLGGFPTVDVANFALLNRNTGGTK